MMYSLYRGVHVPPSTTPLPRALHSTQITNPRQVICVNECLLADQTIQSSLTVYFYGGLLLSLNGNSSTFSRLLFRFLPLRHVSLSEILNVPYQFGNSIYVIKQYKGFQTE